jgi:hypothetical protein
MVGGLATMGPFRWLTVAPKGQPDFELILMPLKSTPMMDEATAACGGLAQKAVEMLADDGMEQVCSASPGRWASHACATLLSRQRARACSRRDPPGVSGGPRVPAAVYFWTVYQVGKLTGS